MITYLVSFILCSGLLLLIYRAFLGNENLYRFNRFYLLFSLVFSLAIPFITIKIPVVKLPGLSDQIVDRYVPAVKANTALQISSQTQALTGKQIQPGIADQNILITEPETAGQNRPAVVSTPAHQQIEQTPAFNYLPDILFLLYGMAALVMLIRFVRNGWHIGRLVAKNGVVNYQDTKLVLIDEEVTPHSFLKYVFINKEEYTSGLIAPEIICHEQTHVRQWHSLDIIIVELLQIVCWFNPFIRLYRKAIQLNHEFLADEAVIENYRDTPAYQYLLLARASQSGSLYLTSQFNYLVTKKRIIMMTKNTSAKMALYKQLALVPVLAGAVLLFCHKVMAQDKGDKKPGAATTVNKKYFANLKKYKQHGITKTTHETGMHAVTPDEWKEIMGAHANYVAEQTKENDVQVFIKKFNAKYNTKYRLPTIQESDGTAMGSLRTKNLVIVESSVTKIIKNGDNSINRQPQIAVTDTSAKKPSITIASQRDAVDKTLRRVLARTPGVRLMDEDPKADSLSTYGAGKSH